MLQILDGLKNIFLLSFLADFDSIFRIRFMMFLLKTSQLISYHFPAKIRLSWIRAWGLHFVVFCSVIRNVFKLWGNIRRQRASERGRCKRRLMRKFPYNPAKFDFSFPIVHSSSSFHNPFRRVNPAKSYRQKQLSIQKIELRSTNSGVFIVFDFSPLADRPGKFGEMSIFP